MPRPVPVSRDDPGPTGGALKPSRLRARPIGAPAGPRLEPGLRRLALGGKRDGLLYVPARAAEAAPAALIVNLHGAGSEGAAVVPPPVLARADEVGALVLAPDSRGRTWDVALGGFGPDVAFLDAALEAVFAASAVDERRIVVAGFSDGASYALSLALANGDLFSHAIAFSPGFMAPDDRVGWPAVFISHGTADPVLHIDSCSRALVPILEQAGYGVTYAEFEGGHEVPATVLRAAFDWMTAAEPGSRSSS